MVKLESELQHKLLELYLILDHQTFGFPLKNADSLQHAISTNILIAPKAQLMLPMEQNSASGTVQVLLLDL